MAGDPRPRARRSAARRRRLAGPAPSLARRLPLRRHAARRGIAGLGFRRQPHHLARGGPGHAPVGSDRGAGAEPRALSGSAPPGAPEPRRGGAGRPAGWAAARDHGGPEGGAGHAARRRLRGRPDGAPRLSSGAGLQAHGGGSPGRHALSSGAAGLADQRLRGTDPVARARARHAGCRARSSRARSWRGWAARRYATTWKAWP